MRRFPVVCTLACAALTGCSTVTSVEPIGKQPLVLVADEWDGTWSDSEDFLEIRVIDPDAGRLEAAWIEIGDDGFELERVEVLLRQSGSSVFGNARELGRNGEVESGGDVETQFVFFRLSREGDKLILWDPKLEAFRSLVEAGTLPGTVTEDGDVVLEPMTTEQLEWLSSDRSSELWDWTEPGILRRTEDD